MSFLEIPNFDIEKAKQYVWNYPVEFVQDFARLLYLRDINGMSISDPKFLAHQDKLIPQLSYALDTWLELNSHRIFVLSESLSYFAYLGLNGTVIPQIDDNIDEAFEKLPRDEHGFTSSGGKKMKCANTIFLASALKLGFADHPEMDEACSEWLEHVENNEGECPIRIDGSQCAYVLVKTLNLLNLFPQKWRRSRYKRVLKNIQDYLLAYDISQADFPRTSPNPNENWMRFGYFRAFQSSIFEAAEALAVSGVKDHRELHETIQVIGNMCVDGVTWKATYDRKSWPLKMEILKKVDTPGSPWLTLRGLRTALALGT